MGFQLQHGFTNALGLSQWDSEGGGGEEFLRDGGLVQCALAGAAVDADMAEQGAAVLQRDADAAGEESRESRIGIDRAGDALRRGRA